ncbi:MAG: prepilin-type N-terminal cleavage/methylation domain-containing protein [bacterium]|nr:prepilin-type N-terminal cleavage/methylation domain-containing protein [bacterium]MCM1374374.1 prepilin-type N-terminal cleavage/methylation domain-containing protein [Muribaculum sp.]
MKQREQTDNRGLSLVEIIVVIAIAAVISGFFILGIGMITGKPVEQCARQMKIVLEQCRTAAMGKPTGDAYLVLTRDSEGVWATLYQGGVPDKKMVGQSDVVVKVILDGTEYDLKDSFPSGLRIDFDRSSGGLLASASPGGGSAFCKSITMSRGSTTRTLTIVRLTGKIQIE